MSIPTTRSDALQAKVMLQATADTAAIMREEAHHQLKLPDPDFRRIALKFEEAGTLVKIRVEDAQRQPRSSIVMKPAIDEGIAQMLSNYLDAASTFCRADDRHSARKVLKIATTFLIDAKEYSPSIGGQQLIVDAIFELAKTINTSSPNFDNALLAARR